MANSVHTVTSGNGWINKLNGEQSGGVYPTKAPAVAAGRELAIQHGAEHTIHNADGTIGEKNSYGNDPRNVRG